MSSQHPTPQPPNPQWLAFFRAVAKAARKLDALEAAQKIAEAQEAPDMTKAHR